MHNIEGVHISVIYCAVFNLTRPCTRRKSPFLMHERKAAEYPEVQQCAPQQDLKYSSAAPRRSCPLTIISTR